MLSDNGHELLDLTAGKKHIYATVHQYHYMRTKKI